MRQISVLTSLAACCLFSTTIDAQETEDSESGNSADSAIPTNDEEDQAFLSGEEKKEIEDPVRDWSTSLAEKPDMPYFSVGARVRWLMIPEWFINWFGVDSTRPPGTGSSLPLISNVGIGPEFTYRKNGLDITAAVWYAGLGWEDPISFKGSDENGNSWEVIENDLHAILITVDFIWSTAIRDWFAVTYGAGLGAGIPWGDIVRTEATFESDGTEKCIGPDPEVDSWCRNDEHYGVKYGKLKVVPWINFLAGARFKPNRHLAIYLDGGFGLGFQIGARAGYIF